MHVVMSLCSYVGLHELSQGFSLARRGQIYFLLLVGAEGACRAER